MADETQGAPSAPPMMAPAQPTEPTTTQVPKRRRVRAKASGNAARGRRKQTPDEKAQAAQARDQQQRERAAQQEQRAKARAGMTRLAAIGALTPELLSTDEISGLAKFVLAMLQQAPAEAEVTQP